MPPQPQRPAPPTPSRPIACPPTRPPKDAPTSTAESETTTSHDHYAVHPGLRKATRHLRVDQLSHPLLAAHARPQAHRHPLHDHDHALFHGRWRGGDDHAPLPDDTRRTVDPPRTLQPPVHDPR